MCDQRPPRAVQLRFISKMHGELATKTDICEYAVSKQWVAALQTFVEADENSGVTVPPLFASDWDDNNDYVGEKSWMILASWYGLESQYAFRRRYTVTSYIDTGLSHSPGAVDAVQLNQNCYVLADNKLDFVTAHCCLLKDLTLDIKRSYINMYFWESLDYVEFQIRCILKVHPQKAVRLWFSLKDDGMDVLLENLSLYDRHRCSVGIALCQKYPEILDTLQKRQTSVTSFHSYPDSTQIPKQDLSSVFVLNEWTLTLCLEVVPTISSKGTDQSHLCGSMVSAVPAAFINLPLSHLFEAEAQVCSDFDEEMKRLLDRSVGDFNKLIVDQKDKLQTRAEQLLKTARESFLLQELELKKKMEEMSVKEDRLGIQEKELNERDHELNSKLAKFRSMLTEFLVKKEKFEKEASQLAKQNSITASRVELNVGGVRFITSVSTLVKEEGSTLQLMFSGQHALQADSDGSYFIDRDGTHFRHVLNFLRDGPDSLEHLPHDDRRLMSELRAEAEHYKLSRMVDILRIKMSEGRTGADFSSLPS